MDQRVTAESIGDTGRWASLAPQTWPRLIKRECHEIVMNVEVKRLVGSSESTKYEAIKETVS